MSPTKTTIIDGGIKHTKESLGVASFTLSPTETMAILGIRSKSTLFRHEAELGLSPKRNLGDYRQYSDIELLKLAEISRGVTISESGDETIITGSTGNQAVLPTRR